MTTDLDAHELLMDISDSELLDEVACRGLEWETAHVPLDLSYAFNLIFDIRKASKQRSRVQEVAVLLDRLEEELRYVA